MYFSYNASSMWFPDLLLYFKLVSNAPYGGKFPAIMIFDLLAQTLNMHINRTGISNILISPDLIQKLLSSICVLNALDVKSIFIQTVMKAILKIMKQIQNKIFF